MKPVPQENVYLEEEPWSKCVVAWWVEHWREELPLLPGVLSICSIGGGTNRCFHCDSFVFIHNFLYNHICTIMVSLTYPNLFPYK